MKRTISITDFRFRVSGYGQYKVTYTSPTTGRSWTATTNDMGLIDATHGADAPKRSDLEALRRACKPQAV